MLLFIVPVFESMFADLGGKLPAPTQVLVFLSDAMKFAAPVLVIGGVVGFVFWSGCKHTAEGPPSSSTRSS